MALLDKGELHLNKKSLDLFSILKASIDSHALQIEKQKAKVSFEEPQSPILINGDETHLSSVFTNLNPFYTSKTEILPFQSPVKI